jgi:excisionase family DNA binding protein
MPDADPDSLVKPSDAAARLRISVKTVRRLVAAGHLDAVRVSPHGLRIRERSVDHLVQYGIHEHEPQEDK